MSVGLFQSSPPPDRLSLSPEGSLSDVPCHRGIRELFNPQALSRMSCHTLRGQIWGPHTRGFIPESHWSYRRSFWGLQEGLSLAFVP